MVERQRKLPPLALPMPSFRPVGQGEELVPSHSSARESPDAGRTKTARRVDAIATFEDFEMNTKFSGLYSGGLAIF